MKRIRAASFWLGLAIVLAVINFVIWDRERIIATGQEVILALAPVDPRSLLQGDYMRLTYDVQGGAALDAARARAAAGRYDGALVLAVDERGVASFVRIDDGSTLAANEIRLAYGWRNRVKLPGESYFFQEGTADRYRAARFGRFRVSRDGDGVLVGLLDENLVPIVVK